MKKILVVDDSSAIRKMIKRFLMSAGNIYTVIEAENGEMAVQLYKMIKPDFVTMDIKMDTMDGIQAAKEIIQMDQNAKIVAITSYDETDKVRDSIRAGVKAFIVKPFTRDYFLSVISKLWESDQSYYNENRG